MELEMSGTFSTINIAKLLDLLDILEFEREVRWLVECREPEENSEQIRQKHLDTWTTRGRLEPTLSVRNSRQADADHPLNECYELGPTEFPTTAEFEERCHSITISSDSNKKTGTFDSPLISSQWLIATDSFALIFRFKPNQVRTRERNHITRSFRFNRIKDLIPAGLKSKSSGWKPREA